MLVMLVMSLARVTAARAAVLQAPLTTSFNSSTGVLTVQGDTQGNTITVSRDQAGTILVNGGAVHAQSGTSTVANTALIEVYGYAGDDVISLDEADGPLPKANMFGNTGNDTLTGGSGADLLFGQAGNDSLLGKRGDDLLFGGIDNDVLTGGDGNDQVFGESGSDQLVWHGGDDNDLVEGGADSDTVVANGGSDAENFTTTANGTRVRFDQLSPAAAFLDIGTAEHLALSANDGNDFFSATGNLAALIQIAVDGGAGNDTLLGSNGPDVVIGGDGNDVIDGNQGNDTLLGSAGDDTFQWDPGDANEIVEGQAGADRLRFNGSNTNEIFDAAANGARLYFTRNVAAIVIDVNEVETIDLNALGGTDMLTVKDLSGTAVTTFNVNLAGTFGGTGGDGQIDNVLVKGTGGNDTIMLVGGTSGTTVRGLAAQVNITNAEVGDGLLIAGWAGEDRVDGTGLKSGAMQFTAYGGDHDDILIGGDNADVLDGEDGDDTLLGGPGVDVLEGGAGNNTILPD
ncbi:MAG: calcium-binding protein [Chloroflexi bacterium]|nr:calcium-binding protein [Chloroflexota bacterium]